MSRQSIIPGTDIDRHADLDAAGEKYVEARDIRMQCSQAEADAKEELHTLMNRYELKEYKILSTDPHLLVTIETVEETVKVKKLADPGSPKTRGRASDEDESGAEVTVEH